VSGLAELLDQHRLAVVCGSGGVGKTTVAASLGAGVASRSARRVLVLTVDPARRLATALGLDRALGNTPVRVADDSAGRGGGELWVAMLDTKQSWDDLVRRHAPDASTRQAILRNPLYQNITGKFVAAHDYIAAECLHELDRSDRWDLIIVDTPPSRHALDFLEAPARMAEFFGSRLLRWLTVPYRSRAFTLASKPFFAVADRILGAQFLADIAEFFILFQTMEKGFVSRARAVDRTLHDAGTTFVVVTTLEAAPVREAETFIGQLGRRGFALGAVVANRIVPPAVAEAATLEAATALADRAGELAPEVAEALGPDVAAPDVTRLLGEVVAGFGHLRVAAERQQTVARRLRPLAPRWATARLLDRDVTDLDGLLSLAAQLEAREASGTSASPGASGAPGPPGASGASAVSGPARRRS
jgi:anion-transporting  ArsA/GET3 family ATPase